MAYTKSNKEKTRQLFEQRRAYGVELARTSHSNLVDLNFGEKFMYGRVSRLFVPMAIADDRTKIKKFNITNGPEKDLGAINFVVDAFNDMLRQFQKCVYTRKIDPTDPYLSNLRVYKAYQNPFRMYENYRRRYFGTLSVAFKNQKIKVRNFNDFARHLTFILEKSTHRSPITRPAFIKSRFCPITCSGLAIEIADLDAANDQEKINQFVNSNNWDFYINACESFGFMVDRRVPWRLVADIGTLPIRSPMLEYAGKYGLNTTDEIIADTYKTVHLDYYKKFKSDMLELYNTVKLTRFRVSEECGDRTITKVVIPMRYTMESLIDEYSEEYFLKLYFNIRIFEEESQFTENQKSIMIDDCIELYQQGGLEGSLDSFELILNKPFDYNGSLGYIKEHLDAIEEEKFQEQRDASATPSMGGSSGY